MGYYRQIFLRCVDATSLILPLIESDWGFRSTYLPTRIREYFLTGIQANQGRILQNQKRQTVIKSLYFSCY